MVAAERHLWRKPTFDDVLEARDTIAPYLRQTPLLSHAGLKELLGAETVVKHENQPGQPGRSRFAGVSISWRTSGRMIVAVG